MNTTGQRVTWTDVNRAIHRLAEAWQAAGGSTPPPPYPNDPELTRMPAALYLAQRGSITDARPASIAWNNRAEGGSYKTAGSATLARSARDSYDMVTNRTAALLDLAADRRNKYQTLSTRAAEWIEAHQADDDATRAIVAELAAALSEGWSE